MIILNRFFKEKYKKNDFSSFFNDASSREKKKLFKEVVRKANEDQKTLVEEYKKVSNPKTI